MQIDRRALLTAPLAAPIAAGVAAAAFAAGPSPAMATGFGDANAAALGVIPDLATDQTAELQGAVDQIGMRGGTLLLPPGRYLVAGLTLRSSVTLRGAGPATRLISDGRRPAIDAGDSSMIGLADLSIEAPPMPGEVEAAPALRFARIEAMTVDGVTISGGGRGVDLERVSGTVRNSVIRDVADVGLFSIDAMGLEIAHNLIEACGNNGIQIWRSAPGPDGTLVSSNRIRNIRADAGGSGQNGNGINVFRAHGVSASGNRIEACAYSALRSNAGSDCLFSANNCTGLGEVAIYAEFGFQGAIITGNLVDDAATGISITNFNEGGRLAVCSGNLIRNLKIRDHHDSRGTGIGAEADTLVTGNVIENAPAAGISLGWGRHLRNVVATNNILRDCRRGIGVSVSRGAGPALIAGNMFCGTYDVAIQGMRHDAADGGDLVHGQSPKWLHLTINGNVATSA